MKVSKEKILAEIILGYRRVIFDRYQYASLRNHHELPAAFTAEKINQFRAYFLTYVYPPPEKRMELNAAFDQLAKYTQQPEKLLRLLLDSTRLLFKYGRHLPKILRAGLKALHSFRLGNAFEKKLVQQAIQLKLKPPYNQAHIEQLLAALSRKEMDDFIQNNKTLFETLYDRPLIQKMIDIVEALIAKMKTRPSVYSSEEIQGLVLGRNLIKEGDALFGQISRTEQKQLLDFILNLEQSVLERLFSKKDTNK